MAQGLFGPSDGPQGLGFDAPPAPSKAKGKPPKPEKSGSLRDLLKKDKKDDKKKSSSKTGLSPSLSKTKKPSSPDLSYGGGGPDLSYGGSSSPSASKPSTSSSGSQPLGGGLVAALRAGMSIEQLQAQLGGKIPQSQIEFLLKAVKAEEEKEKAAAAAMAPRPSASASSPALSPAASPSPSASPVTASTSSPSVDSVRSTETESSSERKDSRAIRPVRVAPAAPKKSPRPDEATPAAALAAALTVKQTSNPAQAALVAALAAALTNTATPSLVKANSEKNLGLVGASTSGTSIASIAATATPAQSQPLAPKSAPTSTPAPTPKSPAPPAPTSPAPPAPTSEVAPAPAPVPTPTPTAPAPTSAPAPAEPTPTPEVVSAPAPSVEAPKVVAAFCMFCGEKFPTEKARFCPFCGEARIFPTGAPGAKAASSEPPASEPTTESTPVSEPAPEPVVEETPEPTPVVETASESVPANEEIAPIAETTESVANPLANLDPSILSLLSQIPLDQLAGVLATTGLPQDQIDALIAAQRSIYESQAQEEGDETFEESVGDTTEEPEEEEETEEPEEQPPTKKSSVNLIVHYSQLITEQRKQSIDAFEEDNQANIQTHETDQLIVGAPTTTNAQGQQVTVLVDAGTLPKLIQRLTFEKHPDPNFLSVFMLTYHAFTTPAELLELLILRYNTPPPPRVAPESWERDKQIPIRLRVVNVLRHWLQKFNSDFRVDPNLLHRLKTFVEEAADTGKMQRIAAEQLKALIIKFEKEPLKSPIQFSKAPPNPHIPSVKSLAKLTILDIHYVELARQLTLMEYDLFKQANPSEYLKQGWKKADKMIRSPNICAMIDRFNLVSGWVSTEVVKSGEPKARANIIAKYINVAEECRLLQNYNGMMEVIAGLQNASVKRLKQTWEVLPSKSWDVWERLKDLVKNEANFSNYRTALRNSQPPCIPYLGLNLSDLVFLEDGNPDILPDIALVNFSKMRMCANIIIELQQYQQTPYCLHPVPLIQEYLSKLQVLSDKDLYKESLVREKGNRKA